MVSGFLRETRSFMPYEHFPWFKDVPVSKILNVEEPSPAHFYWPDLDVDLTAEIIEHPERFPLKYNFTLPLARNDKGAREHDR